MAAYDPEPWHDLFVASSGAAAALAGLVFVAVSINLTRILAYPALPGRVAETVALLLGVLALSLLVLAPGQSRIALGAEVTVVGAVAWGLVTVIHVRLRRYRAQTTASQRRTRVIAGQLSTLCALVAGASLLAHAGGGLYWLLAGTILSLIAAVLNAWVLLIEVAR